MQISTGIDVLDEMLDGGLPNDRTHLLVGGPGTGKSTLSMQYLQEGVENGETCFYITTEQSYEELQDTFQAFDFDLDHENLIILTVHMEEGNTLESEGKTPTLKTLEGEDPIVKGIEVPFNVEYIIEYIRDAGDPDRIVFDSLSGIASIVEDDGSHRHAVLELIHSFNDEMEATALVTAEERLNGGMDELAQSLPFNVHGVIRLWRQPRSGEDHHFIKIEKMRGIDHSKHRYELEFQHDGIHVLPRNRTASKSTVTDNAVSTHINGLDNLLGVGLIPGRLNLMLHDGRASVEPILHRILHEKTIDGFHGIYSPPESMYYEGLDRALEYQGMSLQDMLDDDRLTIFDTAQQEQLWPDRENIVHPGEDLVETVRSIREKRDQPLFNIGHIDPVARGGSSERARRKIWEKLRSNARNSENVFLYVMNRRTASEQLVEYLIDQSVHTINTTVDETGIQYISVEKSIGGKTGYERIVEHRNEPPHVHIPE